MRAVIVFFAGNLKKKISGIIDFEEAVKNLVYHPPCELLEMETKQNCFVECWRKGQRGSSEL